MSSSKSENVSSEDEVFDGMTDIPFENCVLQQEKDLEKQKPIHLGHAKSKKKKLSGRKRSFASGLDQIDDEYDNIVSSNSNSDPPKKRQRMSISKAQKKEEKKQNDNININDTNKV